MAPIIYDVMNVFQKCNSDTYINYFKEANKNETCL